MPKVAVSLLNLRSIASRGLPLLAFLLAVSAWAQPASTGPMTHGAQRMNVLFIVADDLNVELGCYGKEYIKSPNIDRLARSGIAFDRAYCQYPMCAPTRASVLSGARPASTKVFGLYENFRDALPNIKSLPQWFKAHGYFTERFGKVYHLDDVDSWSVARPPPKFGPADPAKRAPYANPAINEAGWRKFDLAKAQGLTGMALERSQRGPAVEIADVEDDELEDGRIARDAVAWLRELEGRRAPFFLAVGFHKPHLPFVAPRKYWELYNRDSLPLARNIYPPENAPHALGDGVEFYTYTDVPPERPIPDDYARLARHGYFACVSYMDAQVGRVIDELDRQGLSDSTIVVFWSDHGFKLGEHGGWGKITNFELDARVPLIVRVPGFVQNARASGLVELVDLYPTLAELAGLPLPSHLEGTSFVPLLHNPERAWKQAAFTEVHRDGGWIGYSMRTSRHRLNRWVKPGEPESFELYDHDVDPDENLNLAGKPEHAETQGNLLLKMKAGWSSGTAQPASNPEASR
jgi:iduronate 2-sulfatase